MKTVRLLIVCGLIVYLAHMREADGFLRRLWGARGSSAIRYVTTVGNADFAGSVVVEPVGMLAD